MIGAHMNTVDRISVNRIPVIGVVVIVFAGHGGDCSIAAGPLGP